MKILCKLFGHTKPKCGNCGSGKHGFCQRCGLFSRDYGKTWFDRWTELEAIDNE